MKRGLVIGIFCFSLILILSPSFVSAVCSSADTDEPSGVIDIGELINYITRRTEADPLVTIESLLECGDYWREGSYNGCLPSCVGINFCEDYNDEIGCSDICAVADSLTPVDCSDPNIACYCEWDGNVCNSEWAVWGEECDTRADCGGTLCSYCDKGFCVDGTLDSKWVYEGECVSNRGGNQQVYASCDISQNGNFFYEFFVDQQYPPGECSTGNIPDQIPNKRLVGLGGYEDDWYAAKYRCDSKCVYDDKEVSCGDGKCEGVENCALCPEDCMVEGQVCCGAETHIGDCCNSNACDEGSCGRCVNNNCQYSFVDAKWVYDGECLSNRGGDTSISEGCDLLQDGMLLYHHLVDMASPTGECSTGIPNQLDSNEVLHGLREDYEDYWYAARYRCDAKCGLCEVKPFDYSGDCESLCISQGYVGCLGASSDRNCLLSDYDCDVAFSLINSCSCTFLCEGSVNLAWDPNTESDLAGYKLYYGPESRVYTNVIDVGLFTEYTVNNLVGNRIYYFALTAYDTSENESDPSVEVFTFVGCS